VDADGGASTVAKVSLPATGTVSLADVSSGTSASLRVSGLDGSGTRRVFGQTLPIDFAALAGVSFDVFVQRTGELARMPSPLSDARPSPVVGVLCDRFVFVGGGDDPSLAKTSQLYDLANLGPVSAPPSLPRAPLSVAFNAGIVAGTSDVSVLLLDATGATWFDLTSSASAEASPPAGATFADVAGGQTLVAADGTSYIVGATRRTGAPTAIVLTIDPKGAFGVATLAAPRLGAAAAWIEGRGVVVAGGSATAPGVEILGPGATSGIALPYPDDAATGAAAVALDASHVLLAGGVASGGADATLREIDLGCNQACAYGTAWTTALPVPLPFAQAFDVDPTTAFVVGEDATFATRAFRVSPQAVAEIAVKAPRSHARAVLLPTGGVAVVGGAAPIESFVP
jgi:hypothetical protein